MWWSGEIECVFQPHIIFFSQWRHNKKQHCNPKWTWKRLVKARTFVPVVQTIMLVLFIPIALDNHYSLYVCWVKKHTPASITPLWWGWCLASDPKHLLYRSRHIRSYVSSLTHQALGSTWLYQFWGIPVTWAFGCIKILLEWFLPSSVWLIFAHLLFPFNFTTLLLTSGDRSIGVVNISLFPNCTRYKTCDLVLNFYKSDRRDCRIDLVR